MSTQHLAPAVHRPSRLRELWRGRRRSAPRQAVMQRVEIAIRHALKSDATTLDRIAQLDSAPPLPAGDRLVAEVDGRVVAAIEGRTGRVISDPFVPTAAAVELLVLREHQRRSGRL